LNADAFLSKVKTLWQLEAFAEWAINKSATPIWYRHLSVPPHQSAYIK
jgi:hypothetical protein